ncbi:hypothetical protein C5167_004894, partial [Papaver somniferum]
TKSFPSRYTNRQLQATYYRHNQTANFQRRVIKNELRDQGCILTSKVGEPCSNGLQNTIPHPFHRPSIRCFHYWANTLCLFQERFTISLQRKYEDTPGRFLCGFNTLPGSESIAERNSIT